MKMAPALVWRRAILAALTFTMVGVLTGCALDTEANFVPDNNPDRALLFFFREHRFVRGGVVALVRIDGKTVGELFNGGLLIAHAPPGDHTIEVQGEMDIGKLSFPLHAEPGKDYYLQVKGQMPAGVGLPTGGAVMFPQATGGPREICEYGSWCVAFLERAEAMAKIQKREQGR